MPRPWHWQPRRRQLPLSRRPTMNCQAHQAISSHQASPLAFVSTLSSAPPRHHHHLVDIDPSSSISRQRRRRRRWNSPLRQFTTSSSEFDKDYSRFHDDDGDDDDAGARSQFGTKSYWDAMYDGMGDFAADEYSWYYGFEAIKPMLEDYVVGASSSSSSALERSKLSILVPGCGNDPLLLDLYNSGYTNLTAFDYSAGALDRQRELLEYLPPGSSDYLETVDLRVEDARSLPPEWEDKFDVVVEKGALDAIYLSGDGNFERSAKELARVVRRGGGVCISVSGVVPEALRREGFGEDEWDWLRDGSGDLKAGCFVLKRK